MMASMYHATTYVALVAFVIAAPAAQAGMCEDLSQFMAAGKKKPAFAPLSDRIARGETIGYVAPSADWGMTDDRKCRIVAAWTKPVNPENHGAYIECEIERHYGKQLDDTSLFTNTLARITSGIEGCKALSRFTRAAISEGEAYTPYQKTGTVWTGKKKDAVVSVYYQREKIRDNRGYYTYLRVQMPKPK